MKILPSAMPAAEMKEFISMWPTGSRLVREPPTNTPRGSNCPVYGRRAKAACLPLTTVAGVMGRSNQRDIDPGRPTINTPSVQDGVGDDVVPGGGCSTISTAPLRST